MNQERFQRLEEVVIDPLFAEIDTDLRQGRHVSSHETERYGFLRDAQAHLEGFYRQYDCELRRAADGFFYLMPNGDRLRRRRLTGAEMLVGQALALLYLDPQTVRSRGVITNAQVVQRLETLVGRDRLVGELLPRRKRHDERVTQDTVREEIGEGAARPHGTRFVQSADAGQLRLCPALLRFAEPVRGLEDRPQALARLIAEGEIQNDDADEAPRPTGGRRVKRRKQHNWPSSTGAACSTNATN